MLEPKTMELWVHKKTGHVYMTMGIAMWENTMQPAVWYNRVGFNLPKDCPRSWLRTVEEFMDGRFLLYKGDESLYPPELIHPKCNGKVDDQDEQKGLVIE